MPTRIVKRFTFEAAHRLPHHDGKCARLHGHTYTVDVALVGELHTDGPKAGMVIDFGDVTHVWKAQVEPLLDHHNLNDTLPIENTTAECIAEFLHGVLDDLLDVRVERVRVYETRTSYAEFPA